MKDDDRRGAGKKGRGGIKTILKTGRKRLLYHPINSSPEIAEPNSFRQSSALSRETRSYAKATKQYPTLERLILSVFFERSKAEPFSEKYSD